MLVDLPGLFPRKGRSPNAKHSFRDVKSALTSSPLTLVTEFPEEDGAALAVTMDALTFFKAGINKEPVARPVSTTIPGEEEDDGPRPPARTWVNGGAGEDWDEGCWPGCGSRGPGASAATPEAAPRPRPDLADPEDPEEEGFTLEGEEEDDLLDFPGIAEGKSAKSPSSPEKRGRSPGIPGNPAGVAKAAHRG